MKELIKKELNYEGKIIFPEHHESHAASAFFPSPFNEAAILDDGWSREWTTTSYRIGKGNSIELSADIKFPHSLGLLYSALHIIPDSRLTRASTKLWDLHHTENRNIKN